MFPGRTGSRRRSGYFIGDSKTDGAQHPGCFDHGIRGHVIESGGVAAQYAQRAALLLREFPYGGILPARDMAILGQAQGFISDRLPQRQGQSRRRVGHILTEDDHGIRLLYL